MRLADCAAEDEPNSWGGPGGSLGPVRRRVYRGNTAKHGIEARGRISREPRDGQEALDMSVAIKPFAPVRVSIDYEEAVFVVLRYHMPGSYPEQPNDTVFHGYSVGWQQLPQEMKNALIRAGMADRRGRIL